MTSLVTACGLLTELALGLVWVRSGVSFCLGIFAVQNARSASRCPGATESIDETCAVSAVIPAYNEEFNIVRAIESLIAAGPPTLRIVVVNDGSRDGTAAVASRALDGRGSSELICLPQNFGKVTALNTGLGAVTSRFLLVLDADTMIDIGSLKQAISAINHARADAISFWIDVDREAGGVLTRLQSIEYVATMNLERAAQSFLGSIAVMPGAATMFRASSLESDPFKDRTCTEDADLTLRLSRLGQALVLCPGARARTVAPGTFHGLLRQRIRWTLGHLQCSVFHLLERGGTIRFRYLTLPNFVIATCSPLIMLFCFINIFNYGETPFLGLDLQKAFLISTMVIYIQRLIAFFYFRLDWRDAFIVLLEPVVTGFVQTIALAASLTCLLRFSYEGGPRWQRLAWRN